MNTKRIRTILLCLVLMLNLVCMTHAETNKYTINVSGVVTYNEATGKYQASYSKTIPGNEYVLLVVAKSADGSRMINANSIMYIDQKTADANGVTFEFIPKSVPDCEVLLAGDFGDAVSPIVLGELVAQGGASITGKITNANAPLVQLGSGDRENFVAQYTAIVNKDGTFAFNGIPEGEYALQISQAYCITYFKANVSITPDTTQFDREFTLHAGDIVPDGAINFSDLSLLIRNYGPSYTPGSPADINGDGAVNFEDLSLLIANYDVRAADIAE